jgi:hypothetical protein
VVLLDGFLRSDFFFGINEILEELDHVFGVNEENIFQEPGLKLLIMLINILIKIKRQLIERGHSSFNDVKNILRVLDQTLRSVQLFNPVNNIKRVIKIQPDLLADNLQLFGVQDVPHHSKQQQVPRVTLKPAIDGVVDLLDGLYQNVQT